MPESSPLVSIAIITYNQKDYLRECIESCLAQDYQNIEIVVADDASTDGTQNMLQSYSERYPGKFTLCLSSQNRGITNNSNLAHFSCKGKYISWMGGDDLMLPGKISAQVRYMEANPSCSICYHDLDVFDSDTNRTLHLYSSLNKPRQGDIRVSIEHGAFNGACATMVRASHTPQNGFNVMIPVASDWLYWVETLNNGGTINYIDSVLGRYRRHINNITAKIPGFNAAYLDRLNSINHIIKLRPEFLRLAIHGNVNIMVSGRRFLPYFDVMFFAAKNRFKIKYIAALAIYVITFGKITI